MKPARDRILDFVIEYIKEHGYSPTTEEIGIGVDLKSKSTVNHHIHIMLDAGMLETDAEWGSARALRVPGMKFVINNKGSCQGWIEKAINYIQNMDLSVFVNKQEASEAVDLITGLLTQQLTNGWILSPPPTGTECLVQTVNDEIIHAYYAGDCKYHFVSYYDRVVQAKVKYWQPLPESYKEVSE